MAYYNAVHRERRNHTVGKNIAAKSLNRLDGIEFLAAIRNGMVMAIPAVMTGAFAVLLTNLPVPAYQAFLARALGGALPGILDLVSAGTTDILVLILVVTISHSYEKLLDLRVPGILPVLCLSSYIVFAIDYERGVSMAIFDNTRLLEGIVVVFLVSRLYVRLSSMKVFRVASYTEGADAVFNAAMSSIAPVVIITSLFAALRIALWLIAGVPDIHRALMDALTGVFAERRAGLGSMVKFVLMVHVMWFMGMHGSNILENVARTLFVPGTALNAALLEAGQAPTEIVSKAFLDAFALMGGCGSTLCLVAAILLFEKRRNVRGLTAMALPTVLFNINEIMLFGLPVVLNVVMLVPFIVVPLVLTVASYLAILWGWVPHTIRHIDWTTPVFLGGYVATGSIAGSLLQAFNLIVGTAIYAPFVRLSQRRYDDSVKRGIDELTRVVKTAEADGAPPSLGVLGGSVGSVCKMLTSELRDDLRAGRLELYYQAQVRYDGTVAGFEALLRWKHPEYGFMYPPLVIALADEAAILGDLGDFITERACRDIERFDRETGAGLCVSINYSASQMSDPGLVGRVAAILAGHDLGRTRLGIEITEQSFLSSSESISERLTALKELGAAVILDDFGMGHSSLVYLQKNHFDEVKLDGSLVRGLVQNRRSGDIIASIVYLSRSLGFNVLAEFVDSEEQRRILHELGCDCYQGYYYSPAIPIDDAIAYLRRRNR